MDRLFDWTGRVSFALVVVTKLLLAAIVVLVVADVVVRNLGLRPIPWAVSAAEYSLLYAAFLPMPWLVRTRGHVFVEFLRKALPPVAQRVLEKAVYVACVALCLYLGGYALAGLAAAWADGAYETRTFDMPQWLVLLPVTLGFLMSALEWLRFLAGRASLYDIDPLEMEGL